MCMSVDYLQKVLVVYFHINPWACVYNKTAYFTNDLFLDGGILKLVI